MTLVLVELETAVELDVLILTLVVLEDFVDDGSDARAALVVL